MNQTFRPAVAVAAFALSALPVLLLPSIAVADSAPGDVTKAGVEHAEREAAGVDRPSKAQVEQHEREQSTAGTDQSGSRQQSPQAPSSSGDGGAAAWQLALSAALGAALTGGVVVASRQVTHHRHVVAS